MVVGKQGINDGRYRLIPRTLIFIKQGNQLLLIKGAKNKQLWANKYNGIGGHVERGENIINAARREVQEETGLKINDLWLCGVITIDGSDNTGIGIFVFRGESTDKELRPSEEGEPQWIEENDYPNLPLVEDLYELLPIVMTIRKNDRVFFAHYEYDENDNLTITFAE